MSAPMALGPEVRAHELRRVARILYETCGIRLRPGKEALVRSRLARRVLASGARSFAEYLDHVEREAGRAERDAMVDALTTNKTSFFRESAHFDVLRTTLAPRLARDTAPIRLWCAGCATGEEAYTIAMVLRDALPPARFAATRILATDISEQALARARAARYADGAVAGVPEGIRRAAFVRDSRADTWVVRDELRAVVRFARLNLMAEWPMHGPFDAIFCRNVMIYFDGAARQRVVSRLAALLAPAGFLIVGHAESLGAAGYGLRYVRPAVYVR